MRGGTPVLIDSADGVYWYILKSAGILVHSQSEMGYIGTFPYFLAAVVHALHTSSAGAAGLLLRIDPPSRPSS